MSYFSKFPYVLDYEVQGKIYDGIDITRRTDVVKDLKNNKNAYVEYSVADGETPEMLADRVYDEAGMYWVILMFNDMFDVHSDWPLSSGSLAKYVDRVYGEDKYSIHHYVASSTGAVVDESYPDYDRIPITNYEHEINANDAKRSIKLPDPDIVPQVVVAHKTQIRR